MGTETLESTLQRQFDKEVQLLREHMIVNDAKPDCEGAPFLIAALLWPLCQEFDDVDVIDLNPLVFVHALPGIFIEDKTLRRYMREMYGKLRVGNPLLEQKYDHFERLASDPFWVKLTKHPTIPPRYCGRRLRISVVNSRIAEIEPWSRQLVVARRADDTIVGCIQI